MAGRNEIICRQLNCKIFCIALRTALHIVGKGVANFPYNMIVHLDFMRQTWNQSEIACYLMSDNKITCTHAMNNYTFGLLQLPRKEKPDLPHSMMVQLDVISAHAASLN